MRQAIIDLESKFQTKEGKIEAFEYIKNHIDVEGIIRYALMDKKDFDGNGFHLAVHVISDTYYQQSAEFSIPHKHDFDEINIIIPIDSNLVYEFMVDGERMNLPAPYTLYIPAGSFHQAKPIKGEGIFICIQLDNKLHRNNKPSWDSQEQYLSRKFF